jgi:hypothetical protein
MTTTTKHIAAPHPMRGAEYDSFLYGGYTPEPSLPQPTGPAYTFQGDAVFGGMVRVTLMADGRMVNRRRDVAPERVETVKAALLAEVAKADAR